MYQHFQKMVACYETEPDNFPRSDTTDICSQHIMCVT